ncbi:Sulfate permease, MFS superfamily [Chroococcus sp. FPU101]|nr:Sulfate permease, MFS superfamily [Chroococcus sp. FPU101]
MPGLAAIRNYNSAWLQSDLIAGLSVAAVAVPIGIACASLAGLPPVHGLYASILPLIVYALFGTSRQLIVGPDTATCSLVATTLAPLAIGDMTRYVSLSMVLAMLVGIFCIIGGLIRLGFLTNFLSRPILTGYLNGIALSIIVGQLGKLFGFSLQSDGFFHLLAEFFSKLDQTHWPTLAVGLSVFFLLRILKHFAPKLPSALIGVIFAIAVSIFFNLAQQGVAIVGKVPAGIPPLKIPLIQQSDLMPLILGAVGLAFVSFNSAMVTAQSFAMKNRYEIDSNQELIALGISDLAAGLSQGFAVSGTDSRTAVNDSVGGKTQLTGIAAAIFMILVLLFLTAPLAYLPITALSALLISAVLGLFDLQSLKRLYRISIPEFRLSILTMIGVMTIGVLKGILIAIGLAIIHLVHKASRPHDAVLGQIQGVDGFHDIEEEANAQTISGLVIYRFDSSLLFFNADFFKARVRSVVAQTANIDWFVLDAEFMAGIDTTAAAKLEDLCHELAEKGITLVVARAKSPLYRMLKRNGLTEIMGQERFFPTIGSAVSAFCSQSIDQMRN